MPKASVLEEPGTSMMVLVQREMESGRSLLASI